MAAVVLVALALPFPAAAQTPPPSLRAERTPLAIRLSWPRATAEDYRLEETPSLTPPIDWQPVTAEPITEGGTSRIDLPASGNPRYFRLRKQEGAVLSTVAGTSPGAAETGVAVTRETIVRFSRPLALISTPSADQFHAQVGDRRILARTQLSTDRLTATLFPLEDLPGGSRVQVTFDATDLYDQSGVAVDADADGQPGGVLRFFFDTTPIVAVPGTAISGTVLASALVPGPDTGTNAINRPLEGVTITVDGAEETLRTTTDALGNFRLDPCPAGRFFVHIDGRTATDSQWPNGAYYPFVGKAWDALAGTTDNLAGGTGIIHLPRVVAGSLQTVSPTETTTITFPPSVLSSNPALTGVTVTVPPNALFNAEGVRGGKVGIAPVPPDRLPEPLPTGLEFPLVITVQTDGPLNFDQPVPIRFPNLPDPATGQPLPPGAKTALWAFNHDTGHWEVQGPMTVTADGAFIECDPGTGIRQPGWVGTNPGSPGGGGPPHPPRPRPNDEDDPCDDTLRLLATEAFLRGVAAGMGAFPGSGNYAGDALSHFLDGEGTPQSYEPGSGASEDLRNSDAFRNELPSIDLALRREVNAAIDRNPGFPTVPNFNAPTSGMNFYGENGSFHQLSYTFGNVSASDVQSRLEDILITPRADGGYEYSANLTFTVTERYQFNQNDDSTIDGLPHDLQECGQAAPFNVSIQVQVMVSGSIRPGGSQAVAPALANTSVPPSRQADGGPHVGMSVAETTLFSLGEEALVVHPDGTTARVSARPAAEGRFRFVFEDATTGDFLLSGDKRGSGNLFSGVILPPNRLIRVRVLHLDTLTVGQALFVTARSGFPTTIPPIGFALPITEPDRDDDGLSDEVESILGTSPDLADSDGDGQPDGAEVGAGQDPLSQRAASTGIVASAPTGPSPADVAAFNDLVVVADSQGISVFNVFGGITPVLVAQLPTSGGAQTVACDARWIAAGNRTGIDLWELTGEATPVFRHHLSVGGGVRELALSAGLVYAAGETDLYLIDAASGTLIDRGPAIGAVGQRLNDLVVAGDYLYVLSASNGTGGSHTLQKIPIAPLLLPPVSSLTISGAEHPTFGRMHLFAGGGYVYVGSADDNAMTQRPGISILEDTPAGLQLLGRPSPITAFDVEVNGSGLALFTGADPGLTGTAKVGVLEVRDPTDTDNFLTAYDTPGAAVAIALCNGLAYAIDNREGLQVINFLPFDRAGQAPSVRLTSNATGDRIQAGDRLRLTAETTDDVQIRQVEFYRNGVLETRDGSFPFEHAFLAPSPTPERPALRVQARAIDTGGNATWSEELVINLEVAAATRGELRFLPAPDSITTEVRSFGVLLDAAAGNARDLAPDELTLEWAGPDGRWDTADDQPVLEGETRYLPAARALLRTLPDELRNGLFRARFAGNLQDLAGTRFAAGTWEFRATSASQFRVVSTTPGGGTVESVSVIAIQFSEPPNPDTVTSENLQLLGAGADGTLGTGDDEAIGLEPLPSSVGRAVVQLRPLADLAPGRYRGLVRREVRDLGGNQLLGDYRWDFLLEDTTPPSIIAQDPTPGTVTSAGPTRVEVYFSEALDPATLNTASLTLVGSGPDERQDTADDIVITGTVGYTPPLFRATLSLGAPLGPGFYRINLSDSVADRAGNPAAPFEAPAFAVRKSVQLRGRLTREDGGSTGGLEVRLSPLSESVVAAPDGTFGTAELDLAPGVRIGARVEGTRDGAYWVGSSASTLPVHRGVTDLGVVLLRQSCPLQLLDGNFVLAPPGSEVNALTRGDVGSGPALYAATGSFYGSRRAEVLRWTGDEWTPVGEPFRYTAGGPAHLRSLLVFDDGSGARLYAGGEFDRVGDVSATNIARWTGSNWEPVGDGLPAFGVRGEVNALFSFDPGTGPRLLAGGAFGAFLGAPRVGVMAWDGSTWLPFDGGLTNDAFAAVIINAFAATTESGQATLYAGGVLSNVGGQPAGNLARWRAGTWEAVPGGVALNGQSIQARIETLASFDDGTGPALFVGGHFDTVDGQPALSVARWKNDAWAPAGTGLWYSFQRRPGSVNAFLVTGGATPSLLAAGLFDQVDNERGFLNGPGLVRWQGTGWEALQDSGGRTNGVNGVVTSLAEFDDGRGSRLYVGGQFDAIYTARQSAPLNFAARRTDDGWEAAGHALDKPVLTLARGMVGAQPDSAYGAGSFVFGGAQRLNGIFRWDGAGYRALGKGLSFRSGNSAATVNTLLVSDLTGTSALYVGGSFERAGDTPAASIAFWNGSDWYALGSGISNRLSGVGTVLALQAFPADAGSPANLVAGGQFESAGGVPARNIARWNGTVWEPLGPGLSGPVSAVASYHHAGTRQLFAGGDFTVSDVTFQSSRGVARWDGTQWHRVMGAGTDSPDGRVRHLLEFDDGSGPALYAAGEFTRARDGTFQNSIGKWDGRGWTYLTTVFAGVAFAQVNDVAGVVEDGLAFLYAIVRPTFDSGIGNQPRLARWDGASWEVFPESTLSELQSLVPDSPSGLLLGGGEGPFDGRLWRWARPDQPCP